MALIFPTNRLLPVKRSTIFILLRILCVVCVIFYLAQNVIIYQFRPRTNGFIITNMTMSYHSLITNENDKNITSLYYRHATSLRNSSYPFISGDTFRALADYVFDETRKDNFDSVKFGDIIFVKADTFSEFFDKPYKSINTSFVLVTHNSDSSAPANRRWPAGNLDKLTYGFENYRKPWFNRTTLLYVNFAIKNNRVERQAALSQASKLENAEIIKTKIAFESYLKQIGNAQFVLSPPGNGLDCHRTWEALLMGAVPVVLSSGLDPLFNGIPAVIINNWSNLTQNFLLSHNFSSYDNLIPVVLYARYWREKLLKHHNIYFKYL